MPPVRPSVQISGQIYIPFLRRVTLTPHASRYWRHKAPLLDRLNGRLSGARAREPDNPVPAAMRPENGRSFSRRSGRQFGRLLGLLAFFSPQIMLPEIFGQRVRIDGRAHGELAMRMAELMNDERVIHRRSAPLRVLRVVHLRFR